MKYDLAVIIPVYNCEKYIVKCIESILDNKCKIQIIVVDDCSSDNTLNTLDKFKDYIELIKLKENKGVSYARNTGLKYVKAKYFTFVDSDDYIESKAFDKLLCKNIDKSVDIICYNYYEVCNDIKIKSKYLYETDILDRDDLIKKFLNDELPLVVWNKIYKYELFKDIKFNEQFIVNEDYEYTLKIISKSNSMLLVNEYLYNYFRNNNSLTTKYTCELIKESNYLKNLDDNTLNIFKDYNEYMYFCYRDCLRQIHLYSQCKDKKNRYKFLKENINKKYLKKLLKINISKSIKLEIIIYLISIRLHLLLFPIYLKIRNKKRKI